MFIVPMNYGYDVREEDGTLHVCLYLHGAKEGRKAAAFAADPRVAVEMDYNHEVITGDYTCAYSYAYRSIMGNGTITEVTDPGAKKKGLGKSWRISHRRRRSLFCRRWWSALPYGA